MQYKKNSTFKPHANKWHDGDKPVQNGLSLTPSDMMELLQSGTPLSVSNLQTVQSVKVSDSDFSVPLEYQRGVDVADMYQFRQGLNERLRVAHRRQLDSIEFQRKLASEQPVVEPQIS